MKKFTSKAQIQQVSFDLKTVLLLHKAKGEDEATAKKALNSNAESFSSLCYSEVSSPIKGKGTAKA